MAQHRLSQRDDEARTAVCAVCGPTALKLSSGLWRCPVAVQARIDKQEASREPRDRGMRYPWRRAVQDRLMLMTCERCGFVAEDLCQLDVDHIVRRVDGGSDDPSNLMVLCANCHRLKTRLERTTKARTTSGEVRA